MQVNTKRHTVISLSRVRGESRAYDHRFTWRDPKQGRPKPGRMILAITAVGGTEYLTPALYDGETYRHLENGVVIDRVFGYTYVNEKLTPQKVER